MKGIGVPAIAAVATVLVVASAGAEETSRPTTHPSRGEDLYLERCSDCHGSKGERKALGRSKALNRLSQSDIVGKLQEYRTARRIRGMKDKMKSGLTDDDITSLAAYIRLFERQSRRPAR